MMLGLFIVSGYTSINAVVKAELFPARIRALGVGLPYALTVAIFGGTTEYIALGLKKAGHESWFFYYVAAAALVSLLVYVFMGESSRRSQLERETSELRSGDPESATPFRHPHRVPSISVMQVRWSRTTRVSDRRWPNFSARPVPPSSVRPAVRTPCIG